jgi:hypothetical protein
MVIGSFCRAGACVLLILTGLAAAACETVLNSGEPFKIVLHNDLRAPVKLARCANRDCTSFDYVDDVPTGGSADEVMLADGELRSFRVQSASGATLGCLPFRFDQAFLTHVARYPVSIMVPCGKDAGSSSTHGSAWPNP